MSIVTQAALAVRAIVEPWSPTMPARGAADAASPAARTFPALGLGKLAEAMGALRQRLCEWLLDSGVARDVIVEVERDLYRDELLRKVWRRALQLLGWNAWSLGARPYTAAVVGPIPPHHRMACCHELPCKHVCSSRL